MNHASQLGPALFPVQLLCSGVVPWGDMSRFHSAGNTPGTDLNRRVYPGLQSLRRREAPGWVALPFAAFDASLGSRSTLGGIRRDNRGTEKNRPARTVTRSGCFSRLDMRRRLLVTESVKQRNRKEGPFILDRKLNPVSEPATSIRHSGWFPAELSVSILRATQDSAGVRRAAMLILAVLPGGWQCASCCPEGDSILPAVNEVLRLRSYSHEYYN